MSKFVRGFLAAIILLVAVLAFAVGVMAKVEVPMCTNPNNWHPIMVDQHSVKAHEKNGDFVIDETHPCPPEGDPQHSGDDPFFLYLPIVERDCTFFFWQFCELQEGK
jgi:hypothetical protein